MHLTWRVQFWLLHPITSSVVYIARTQLNWIASTSLPVVRVTTVPLKISECGHLFFHVISSKSTRYLTSKFACIKIVFFILSFNCNQLPFSSRVSVSGMSQCHFKSYVKWEIIINMRWRLFVEWLDRWQQQLHYCRSILHFFIFWVDKQTNKQTVDTRTLPS